MKEIEQSTSIFSEVRNMIMQHIADARLVDEKLHQGIQRLHEWQQTLQHQSVSEG